MDGFSELLEWKGQDNAGLDIIVSCKNTRTFQRSFSRRKQMKSSPHGVGEGESGGAPFMGSHKANRGLSFSSLPPLPALLGSMAKNNEDSA